MNEHTIKVTGRVLTFSKATQERNPHLFRPDPSSKLRAEKSEQNRGSEGEDRGVEAPAESIRFRVTIIVRRPRLLDHGDNDRGALKPIRDFTAKDLGFKNDDDPRLEWVYHQIKDKAKSTTVLIETISHKV